MLANKHVMLAMVVAPVLAIIAWFGVDALLGPRPEVALAGKSYPLLAKSNCRYASGACTLENEDFSLEVRFADNAFVLSSPHKLQGAWFAVGDPDVVPNSMTLMQDGESAFQQWRINTLAPQPVERIYVVVKYNDITFFGDAATTFAYPE